MHLYRRIMLVLLLLLTLSISAACGQTTEGTIRIGTSLALTGPLADTGRWVEQGFRYWEDQVNANGGLLGQPVEIIIEDNGNDPAQAATQVTRLITVDNVDLLLGSYPTVASAATMPIAEQYEMVYIGIGGNLESFEQGFTYSFGAPPIVGEWWYTGLWEMLAAMPDDTRPQTAAVISMNNPIGATVLTGIEAGLADVGIEVVMLERFDPPLADATALVAEAQTSGADLFISNTTFGDGVQIVQAMQTIDMRPAMFCQTIGTVVPEWVGELGDAADYTVSGAPLSDQLPTAEMTAIREYVQETYELDTVPLYFLLAYSWAQTLQQGVEGSGTLDQAAIRDYLRAEGVTTVAGPLTFDERGLPEPSHLVTQILDGQIELIWPLDVQTADLVYPAPPWDE
jgi:branched-chain amino acid transport system substrate-binding protein